MKTWQRKDEGSKQVSDCYNVEEKAKEKERKRNEDIVKEVKEKKRGDSPARTLKSS